MRNIACHTRKPVACAHWDGQVEGNGVQKHEVSARAYHL